MKGIPKMSLFSDASIQRKLVMVISCTSLLGLSIGLLAFDVLREDKLPRVHGEELTADANILGLGTAPSLAFKDAKIRRGVAGRGSCRKLHCQRDLI